jgi:16S rRNA (guanine527-N7)-methyltransferase
VFAEILAAKLQSLVDLSGSQIELLEKHFFLLQHWNKILNLTSLENPDEVIERHYAESLFLGAQLPTDALSIVDVGSGAGFPGIPVAILRPECRVTLVESHKRKSVFLREACRNLPNITVSADRIEAVKVTFDWSISRAVKFEDIEKTICTLSGHTALLTGGAEPGSGCFTWNKPIRLPWGEKRHLWIGTSSFHVKQL